MIARRAAVRDVVYRLQTIEIATDDKTTDAYACDITAHKQLLTDAKRGLAEAVSKYKRSQQSAIQEPSGLAELMGEFGRNFNDMCHAANKLDWMNAEMLRRRFAAGFRLCLVQFESLMENMIDRGQFVLAQV